MLAQFGLTTKRANSTFIPTLNVEAEIYLKEPTSITRPRIEVQAYHNPASANCAYLPDFGRYYWIAEWTYNQGVWEAQLEEDYLASWKEDILNSSAYVVYSSSLYNPYASDNRIATTAEYTVDSEEADFSGVSFNHGTYALTVYAEASPYATGSATTYFMNSGQMASFARELVADDIFQKLTQFFVNPLGGIIDCYYLPIEVSEYITLSGDRAVTIGDYEFTATGKCPLFSNFEITSQAVEIEIPWQYSDFRRLSPYTELSMFVPFCGAKTLPTELLAHADILHIDYSVDVNTGAVQAMCYADANLIAEFSGNMRVMLPVANEQPRVDSVIGAGAGMITAIGGAATGNPAMIGLGALSAVNSVVTPATYNICGGMNGSILGAVLGHDSMRWQKFRLSAITRQTTDTPSGIRGIVGNALNKVVQLGALTGYCRTQDFSLYGGLLKEERDTVNNMMDGGVYLE